MKMLSETRALEALRELKDSVAAEIRTRFEHRAKPCAACDTPGACCLDSHFVNVRISRLEAKAIRRVIEDLPAVRRKGVEVRIADAIERYGLSDGEPERTYACPLYEAGTGCLVHAKAKPLPCIMHACYENNADLPPEELMVEAEAAVERLNVKTYGRATTLASMPIKLL
jgi:hypothetical protein